jgi:hypothetical protein
LISVKMRRLSTLNENISGFSVPPEDHLWSSVAPYVITL